MPDIFANLAQAFADFGNWTTLVALVAGLVLGIVIGVLPGLGPLAGISLAIPFTFYMTPTDGMALLIGIYHGGSYGGALTACLIGIPGTPIAAATTLDGYPMTLNGQPSEAATLATISSVFGGVLGSIALILVAQPLAGFAMRIGPPELFALALLGLTTLASVTEGSFLKSAIAGIVGLGLATVGNDPLTGYARFDFGLQSLQGGFDLIVILMGIFSIAELMILAEGNFSIPRLTTGVSVSWPAIRMFFRKLPGAFRASAIGVSVGAVPGVGAVTSAYLAYSVARNSSNDPESFGKGNPDGVIATEAANSATVGGALLPMLAIGIPGEPIAAALMAGLLIHGLTPGPLLFATNPEFVAGIFLAILIGAVLLLPVAFLALPVVLSVLKLPKSGLVAGIFLLSSTGVFALASQVADLWAMMGFGVLGYLMRKFGFPASPLVLGLVLGPIFESNLRRTVLLAGNDPLTYFVGRPITLAVFALCLLALAWNIRSAIRGRNAGRDFGPVGK